MDWKECSFKKLSKEIRPDGNLTASLLKSSAKKISSQKLLPLNEDTASSKVTLAYDALGEVLEALSVLKGYKIYNHECYVPFLAEIINEHSFADRFDKFRRVRNSINYYGKEISPGEAGEIIKGILELLDQIRKKFFA